MLGYSTGNWQNRGFRRCTAMLYIASVACCRQCISSESIMDEGHSLVGAAASASAREWGFTVEPSGGDLLSGSSTSVSMPLWRTRRLQSREAGFRGYARKVVVRGEERWERGRHASLCRMSSIQP
ncbi:hypothetical protein DENSPDRAFT_688981 [Dentipellis sp. KUC8613]|nr:hypothetical protein DENSPDRAFT_688981 [Dentipellis sp. KUC8613]